MNILLKPTLFLLASLPAWALAQVPDGFGFTPTPSSATIYGQAQIDGVPCAEGDWVAAFDPAGNCAGAAPLYLFEGAAYINLQIYGDDATTNGVDEGMDSSESFSLRLYDASEDTVLVYQSPLNPVTFEGWNNTNGAPLPGLDDAEAVFDWITVDVGFDVPFSHQCLQGEETDLASYAYPSDGTFAGPGVTDGVFSPSEAGVGIHVLSFTYSLATVFDTVEVYGFDVQLTGTPPLCFGEDTGVLTASATGGYGSVSYDFDGANPLAASEGSYAVTGTDELGCQSTAEATLVNPPLLAISTTTQDALCAGDATGEAQAVTEGGTGNITLDWMGTDPSSLLAGAYEVIATDENGCTATTSFDIQEPSALEAEASVSSVLCAGGSSGVIGIETSGGTPPYQTDWGGEDPSALLQGSYVVVISDDNGCTLDLMVEVDEPTGLSLSIDVSNVLCQGDASGTASLTVQGGTAPYDIDWQGETPEALSAGSYEVVVTDDNACASTLTFDIQEPEALAVGLTATDVDCFGESTGTVDVSLAGGTGEVTWDINAADAMALAAGTYVVTATDENGCTSTQSIEVSENPLLSGSFATSDVTCFGDGNGFASFQPQGGLAPYTLDWIGVDPMALDGGLHHVQVSDAAGCGQLFSVDIHEPLPLSLTAVATRANCIDGTGVVGFSAAGGSGTYIVDWEGLNLNAAPIGTHNYTISDTNGCVDEGNVTIFPPLGECGCNEPNAVNYNPSATSNDGSCEFTNPCPADLSNDGVIGLQDLLVVLSGFGLSCE